MSQKTKTLLVGIDDYPPVGANGQDLNGCKNDLIDISEALKTWGFSRAPEKMKFLTDNNATKSNVTASLAWLIQDATPGDSLVFYFSGHGSFIPGNEPDGTDEVLCTHDQLQFIRDNELQEIFDTLPEGVTLTTILDCCYSGTGIRLSEGTSRVKFMTPPTKTIKKTSSVNRMLTDPIKHTLWAACAADQRATEDMLDEKIRSVFTYHFTQELLSAPRDSPREILMANVIKAIKAGGFTQIPELETPPAKKGQPIFE